MSTPESSPSSELFPKVLASRSSRDALRSLGAAAYTLYIVPEHETLHADVAQATETGPELPLQPSRETLSESVDAVLKKTDVANVPNVDRTTLTRLSGVLIQFTDHVPGLQNIQTPYANIAELHQSVQERAAKSGPLALADQLELAVEQANGNLTDALWQLFVTSRLHARWLDSSIISNMPDFAKEEKLDLMKSWHDSIAAFKEREEGLPQDTSGDTYYAWTHALAKVAFTLMPHRQTLGTRAGVHVFHHGTALMQNLVHTIARSQSVKSDHTIAANYGNTLGQIIVTEAQQATDPVLTPIPRPETA